jgi:hypothetical protein
LNVRPAAGQSDRERAFDQLMRQVMTGCDHFGHHQHVQLTWLAVRHYGVPAAIDLISDGIRRTARYEKVPQKYHATISRAWVELIGHHLAESGAEVSEFATFVEHHPALLDKRLLTRFYRSATLASSAARTGWVEPDADPFPFSVAGRAGRNPAEG